VALALTSSTRNGKQSSAAVATSREGPAPEWGRGRFGQLAIAVPNGKAC
jgi:hypothetical protein